MVDRTTVGEPWGSAVGLLQFRGNPTHTWYGRGPAPRAPDQLWRFPDGAMCSNSSVGSEVTRWCGTGWTGQPAVWEHDGVTEVIFGAYDAAVHFVDAHTGQRLRPDFRVGDLIKGSVTVDPDGYPLLYFGSRDNRLRIVALDRDEPTELFALEDHPDGVWNNDWDGNPSIVDGMLIEGGEDSFFYALELNRAYDTAGKVTVDPEVVVEMPAWNDELLAAVGDNNVSVESSVAVFEGRAYMTNSGGRVLGVDLERVQDREAAIVFDYWLGDDADASLVIDAAGDLYATVELERFLPRADEVGQLVKLDPSRPDDPLVWSVAIPPREGTSGDGGAWGTPALHRGHLYATTHAGDLMVVDADDGEVVWRERIGYHEWSSPVVVDDTLIVGACEGTGIRAWNLADPSDPSPLWTVRVGGCVESTPAVWEGRVFVGSRDGYFYAFGDR